MDFSNSAKYGKFDETIHSKQDNDDVLNIKEKVKQAIHALDNKDKQIIELFYIEEYSLKQISKKLNLSIGTVKSRLYYAKKRFKKIYQRLFKEDVYMKKYPFPNQLPHIKINEIHVEPFQVDYKQVRWWFYEPKINNNCLWASYDYPNKTLTSITKMKYLGQAKIHDIDCIEFHASDYNFNTGKFEENAYNLYARLTNTHVQWVGQFYIEDNKKVFKTFIDEDFIENFGNLDLVKGNERMIKDENKYFIQDDETIKIIDQNKSNGCGFFQITIGHKTIDCIRVLEPSQDILVETFISKEGKTILFRRYNAVTVDKPWDKQLPENKQLNVDGIKYVHWYDCLTEDVL